MIYWIFERVNLNREVEQSHAFWLTMSLQIPSTKVKSKNLTCNSDTVNLYSMEADNSPYVHGERTKDPHLKIDLENNWQKSTSW
jgi:hypothetical protein